MASTNSEAPGIIPEAGAILQAVADAGGDATVRQIRKAVGARFDASVLEACRNLGYLAGYRPIGGGRGGDLYRLTGAGRKLCANPSMGEALRRTAEVIDRELAETREAFATGGIEAAHWAAWNNGYSTGTGVGYRAAEARPAAPPAEPASTPAGRAADDLGLTDELFALADQIEVALDTNPGRTWSPSEMARKVKASTDDTRTVLRYMVEHHLAVSVGSGAWTRYSCRNGAGAQ